MDENEPERPSSNLPLTARELEIVQLLVEGFSNPKIAAELSLSPRTVQSHVASALAKTGARSRTHLAVIAVRSGVAPSDAASADDEA
jgi:DNA-binding NarL/FixJ family response regulator